MKGKRMDRKGKSVEESVIISDDSREREFRGGKGCSASWPHPLQINCVLVGNM